jgi:hypothetical protein
MIWGRVVGSQHNLTLGYVGLEQGGLGAKEMVP